MIAARLAAQRLSPPRAAGVLEATRHLLAVQAQDARGARLALRVRTPEGSHASDVDAALDERALLITWANRGTLHLIAAEDEPWLHALTTAPLRTGSERRLRQEGVSPAAARRGVDAIAKALAADGPLTRGQIREVLRRARVPSAGQALVHVLFSATLDGLIVRGPMIGAEHAFVLAVDWLGERPRVERDAALAELARRYLRGHGPADERDLARWAGLPLRDARTGLNAIASELVRRADGLVDLRDRPEPATALPPPLLLGPYDPLLLGWRSRELVLGDADGIVTTNGLFRPFALVDGRAAGTWALPDGRVRMELFGPQPRATREALEREAAAVEAYLSPRTAAPPSPAASSAR